MGALLVLDRELLLEVDLEHEAAVAGDVAGEDVAGRRVEDVAVLRRGLVVVGDGRLGVGGAGALDAVRRLGRVGAVLLVVELDRVLGVGVGRPLGRVGNNSVFVSIRSYDSLANLRIPAIEGIADTFRCSDKRWSRIAY